MSLTRAWYVKCDHCGKPAPVDCFGAREARAAATGEGFVKASGGIDLCPECASSSVVSETTPNQKENPK